MDALPVLAVFLLVTGGVVALVLSGVMGGLLLGARQRHEARQIAAQLGWTHRGDGEFSGVVGESQWRGGSYSDPEAAGRWTEFSAGVLGLAIGGFHIGNRAAVAAQRAQADPQAEAMSWRELAAGSAQWRKENVMLASDDRWCGLIDPEFETLWLTAGAPNAHAHAHQLQLRRDDGAEEASSGQVIALLQLGEKLLQGMQRVLASQAR